MVRGVADGGAEIGVCRDVVPTAGLEIQTFRHDHFALIVAAAHPLAGHAALGFADTLEYDQIGLSSNASMYPLLQRIAAEHGREWRVRMHVCRPSTPRSGSSRPVWWSPCCRARRSNAPPDPMGCAPWH